MMTAASTEVLPATFPSADRALEWSRHLTTCEVVDVIPAKDKPGRYRLKIRRTTRKDTPAE